MHDSTSVPWYREPWPWFLMAGPAAVVVAGLVTYWIAFSTHDGLVADDYYKRGLAINQVLARSERAHAMDLVARVAIRDQTVEAELDARHDMGLPPAVILRLVHPTRVGMDQSVRLSLDGARYRGRFAAAPIPGRWQVVLEDESGSWLLSSYRRFPDDARFTLSAREPQHGMQ